MMRTAISKVLRDGLEGPIIPIIDPGQHDDLDILKSYFREILLIARNYARPTVDYEDLVDEGLIGLLDAIRRFDPEKATGPKAFHQLAIVRIKSFMFEFFLNNNTQYSVPNYMARAMTLVDQIRAQIDSAEFSANPEAALRQFECLEFEETAPLGVREKVASLKERVQNLASNSKRSYTEMVDLVLKIEENIESYEQEEEFEVSPEQLTEGREFLDRFLNSLKPDARDVIVSLLQGNTLTEVGEMKGFTRERARQIKEEAIQWLHGTRMYKE
jgi:RNA polymerase sigma factor (sigma-70 family)